MSKLIGGILLIIGTSIGAGMLALPLVAASGGFWSSSLLLLFCWALMTLGALALLEVSLWLPENNNMISMAGKTLGRAGQALAWAFYLALFYALVSAYIAGGADVIHSLFQLVNISIPLKVNVLIFTFVLGYIVYRDITSVDKVNRVIMSLKFLALVLLIFSVMPHVEWDNLQLGESRRLPLMVTVAITSFGYAGSIPTLRTYFKGDHKRLRQAIWIGGLIPLLCYLAWDLVIIGAIHSSRLLDINQSATPVSDLTQAIVAQMDLPFVSTITHVFTSVCVFTSFLSVSLGLSDFLADGCKLPKKRMLNKFVVMALTFAPPLIIVLSKPTLFITSLNYAGIFCVTLLVLLPALMVWFGRYVKDTATTRPIVPGGKKILIFMIVVSLMIIVLGFWQDVIR